MLILVTGGSASGKSAHAERLLCEHAASSRLYLATMQPFGAAAQKRIARHRALRQGKGFQTVERPLNLAGLELPRRYDGILLEDLGNLLANELFAPRAQRTWRSAASLQGSGACKTAAKRWSL